MQGLHFYAKIFMQNYAKIMQKICKKICKKVSKKLKKSSKTVQSNARLIEFIKNLKN